MNIFMLDLWHDLRAKRVWPVAILLVAALVAVPLVVAKPAEEPAAPPPSQTAQVKPVDKSELGRLAQVRLAKEEAGDGSTLGVFDPENPFTPPEGAVKNEADEAPQSDAGPSDSSHAPSAGTDQGGSGGSGGSGDAEPPTGGDDGGTKTASYRYVIDVTFTTNGRTRRVKGLEKLDMLPNQASPLLIFLGVTDNAGNAVFLVDSTLQAAGEGKCKPSRDDCAFLYLGAGSEHEFTNEDGDSYRLRIDEIRKVKIGSASASSASHRKAKSARAAVQASVESRRFASPLMTDVVTTSIGNSDNSTGQSSRR
jgi:hypothetical protein